MLFLGLLQKNQLAVTLQLSEGEEAALDSASNATGIRLALTITCSLKKAAEAFRSVPTNTSTNGTSPNKTNLTLLRTVSDSLFESSCLWVRYAKRKLSLTSLIPRFSRQHFRVRLSVYIIIPTYYYYATWPSALHFTAARDLVSNNY